MAEKQATPNANVNLNGPKPNIIYILADDLGMGDLGCYGQKALKTPNLDKLAAEGMRFTNAYSGAMVCAPSRCVLMTGKHLGHATVRDNWELFPEGQYPLRESETTVAQALKSAGYATGLCGKWGLGAPDSVSTPAKKGVRPFLRLQLPAPRAPFLHRLSLPRQRTDRDPAVAGKADLRPGPDRRGKPQVHPRQQGPAVLSLLRLDGAPRRLHGG